MLVAATPWGRRDEEDEEAIFFYKVQF